MSAVFADTFYFFALLNRADEAHFAASRFAADGSKSLLTTAWVLTELADGLAETGGRTILNALLLDLENDARTQIIGANAELWREGVVLYGERPDKQWSLTDCISFVVMKKRGIQEALTADHHFEQAGFTALLK